jgi:RNA polymerase sigma-70 factor (ECF subfamily)
MVDQKTFTALKKGDRRAQKAVYDELSPQMYAVCRRYIANEQDAEDIMIKGFFNAFTKLEQLDEPEALEAWMRRIMVNECLMYHRRNKKFKSTLELNVAHEVVLEDYVLDQLTVQEIFSYIDQLPDGYRTVFNLYCIEGYKHREIADMLDISINTSKSQLILARKRLRARIEANNKIKRSNEQ